MATKDEAQPPPEWKMERPRSSAYYIGIGSGSKVAQPLDYQAIAKKNALNDLASEISVRVKGETFLNSLEVNKNFSEEFMATISTTTNELIENYDIAGIWENDKEYWVYYRLNKAQYQQQKLEKKNRAMSAAHDYYLKGKEAEEQAQIVLAFDQYFRGLFALKEYWNEVNEYRTENGNIFLDNEIYRSLQRTGSGLAIRSDVARIVLSSENAYHAQVPLKVMYEGKPVRNISAEFRYEKSRYMKPRTVLSDEFGTFSVMVEDVDLLARERALDVRINLEPLVPQDLDKAVTIPLVKSIKADRKIIPIEVQTPSFFIRSEESMFGAPGTTQVLAQAFQSQLVKEGMRISKSAQETDYLVSITSNTTEGGMSQGFYVSWLEMTVQVKNARTNEIAFQQTLSNIKGVQLNTQAAGTDAYKKGQEKIESEVVKALMNAIF